MSQKIGWRAAVLYVYCMLSHVTNMRRAVFVSLLDAGEFMLSRLPEAVRALWQLMLAT